MSYIAVPIQIAQGGTGSTTAAAARTALGITNVATQSVTQYAVIVGGAANALSSIGPGSSGQILQSTGASSNPAYTTATYPSTATGTGKILRADGTNWVATTATYPETTTQNRILYSSSNDIVGQITGANGGVLTTDPSTGAPSIDTTNFVRLTTGMQVKGNNTNTAPPAGFIGEQIRGFAASGSVGSFSSGTYKTITSITLTPGVWDVSFNCRFSGGAITGTGCACGIATATNSTTGFVDADNTCSLTIVPSAAADVAMNLAQYRILVSANTTYYLTAAIIFSGGTPTAGGRLSAVRVG